MNVMQAAVHAFLIKHLGQQPNGWANHTGILNKWLLIHEEFEELAAALGLHVRYSSASNSKWTADDIDMVATIDAICDLLYVVLNMCEELELDIQPFFDEVHRSNMTKVTGNMSAARKILKGSGYRPPRLHELYEFYKTGKVYCPKCTGLGFRRAYADGKEMLDPDGDPILIDCPAKDCVQGFIKREQPMVQSQVGVVADNSATNR